MILRRETVIVRNGTGRLAIHQKDGASGFFVNGVACAMNWPEGSGSIAQEFFVSGGTRQNRGESEFRELTEKGPAKDRTLLGQFQSLLHQFPSGEYQLTVEDLEDWWMPDPPETVQENENGGYYPYTNNLIPTQSLTRLDETRILEWMVAIGDGQRPLAILAAVPGDPCSFILDGHHKLTAYDYERVPPRCLRIWCPGDQPLSRNDWPHGLTPPWHWQ